MYTSFLPPVGLSWRGDLKDDTEMLGDVQLFKDFHDAGEDEDEEDENEDDGDNDDDDGDDDNRRRLALSLLPLLPRPLLTSSSTTVACSRCNEDGLCNFD